MKSEAHRAKMARKAARRDRWWAEANSPRRSRLIAQYGLFGRVSYVLAGVRQSHYRVPSLSA